MGELDYKNEVKNWTWDIPEFYNIGYDCVDKHAEGKNKDSIALLWENEQGDTETYTFADMKKLTNKFGNILRDLSFKKGDRFLIRLPNIPAFHVCFPGCGLPQEPGLISMLFMFERYTMTSVIPIPS